MIYIGIDQSLSNTGICVLGKQTELYAISPKSKGVERLKEIKESIFWLIMDIMCDNPEEDIIVVREGYSYGSKGHLFELGELGGAIDLAIIEAVEFSSCEHGQCIEYTIPVTSWKKFIFGKGNVKKDTTYLLKVLKKTGREFDSDDKADAYMIASCFKAWREITVGETSPSTLTNGQKFASLSKQIKTKNKITEKKIGAVEDNQYVEMLKASIDSYRRR